MEERKVFNLSSSDLVLVLKAIRYYVWNSLPSKEIDALKRIYYALYYQE